MEEVEHAAPWLASATAVAPVQRQSLPVVTGSAFVTRAERAAGLGKTCFAENNAVMGGQKGNPTCVSAENQLPPTPPQA